MKRRFCSLLFFARSAGVNDLNCGGKCLTKQEIYGILVKYQEIGNRPGTMGGSGSGQIALHWGRPVCERLHGRSHFS